MKKLNFKFLKSISIIILSIVTVLTTVLLVQKMGEAGADSVTKTKYSTQTVSSISEAEYSEMSSSICTDMNSSVSINSESIISLDPTITPLLESVSCESNPPEISTVAPTKAVKPIEKARPTAAPTLTIAPTATAKPVAQTKLVLDNLIGQTVCQITKTFGNPNARELSEYGFTWFVYNSNYKNFIMIGIENNIVVGVYSNSNALNFHGLKVGNTRTNVRKSLASASFGSPLESIKKNGIPFLVCNPQQRDVFFDGTSYTTVFYDTIKGSTLTSIQIIEKKTEMLIGYYPDPSPKLEASLEKTSFYLMNAIRSRNGIALFTWNDTLATIARAHSVDMCVKNYFSHNNPSGLSSSARFKAAGLCYKDCAENIAKNHSSAITAHESYMNSSGHRANILNSCKNVGVGVYMGNGDILLTQNFMTFR